jgi:hypothetical protein
MMHSLLKERVKKRPTAENKKILAHYEKTSLPKGDPGKITTRSI